MPLIQDVVIHFVTEGDDREGGHVTVQLIHDGQVVFAHAYPEYPGWNANSANVTTDQVNREMPTNGLVGRVILQEAIEKNIGWNFSVDIRLKNPDATDLAVIAGTHLRLDTTHFPYPASVHVDFAQ